MGLKEKLFLIPILGMISILGVMAMYQISCEMNIISDCMVFQGSAGGR